MSTLPIFGPKARFFDANGDPLAGGKLYSYAAGTSTPLATYTTRAGTIANTNPVILDANGEADVWSTPGVLYKFVLKNSADATQWTVDNVPSPSEVTAALDNGVTEPGGRLSLTSGTAVTTSDVTGSTTVFYVPHKHKKVPLWDGSAWSLATLAAELSQTTSDTTKSPAAVAASKNYDMFVWSDAGTLRLSRGPAWTSDTARGTGAGTTELEVLDCRRVNKVAISNGPAAQRGLYVGTIRSNGSSQFADSLAKRYVWNAYNRLRRSMKAAAPGSSWSYASTTLRQANASIANQLDYVAGLSEDPVCAAVQIDAKADSDAFFTIGIGVDSTIVASGVASGVSFNNPAQERNTLTANYEGLPGIGKHTLAWLEAAGTGGQTVTFFAGSSGENGAIFGHLFA
jgi:hypothetical protein